MEMQISFAVMACLVWFGFFFHAPPHFLFLLELCRSLVVAVTLLGTDWSSCLADGEEQRVLINV